jgi:hypothetical protein
MSLAAYERTFSLPKPLGIALEELEGGGVRFMALQPGGSAAGAAEAAEADIAPGDRLLRVGERDVTALDFDAIMDLLATAPSPVTLTVDDGIAQLDITPNLAKALSAEEAVLSDLVVRAAARECRRLVGQSDELTEALGELISIEILLGAAVRKGGECLVRFFGIFSTDGGTSTYSCNVSATGVRRASDGTIDITALSCAKDEGWGRTIDLKRPASD